MKGKIPLAFTLLIAVFMTASFAASACSQYIDSAESALAVGDYSSAAAAYEQAAECYADDGKSTQAAQYYSLAAENLINAGEQEQAAQDYLLAAQYYRADKPRSCGDEALSAAELYKGLSMHNDAVSAYSVSFQCYRDAGDEDNAFKAALGAAVEAEQNNEPSTALEYYNHAIAYGEAGRVGKELCPVYEALGDLIKETYPAQAAENYSKAGICYRDYSRDPEKCDQAFGKAIDVTSGSRIADYSAGAGSCYKTPKTTLEMQKCWEHYAAAANIYEQVGKYEDAGAAYKSAGDCMYRDKTESGKKIREDAYYKCAKEYVTASLSLTGSEAADTLLNAKACYDLIKDANAKQLSEVLSSQAIALRTGEKVLYNLSVLAENPKASKTELLLSKPNETGEEEEEVPKADNTLLYAGIVVVVLVLLIASLKLLRKKPEELEMPEEEEETPEEEEYKPF